VTLKLNPSAPATQLYESSHEVVQLKPRGAGEAGALREETLSSRVAQVPFLARFAVINLVKVSHQNPQGEVRQVLLSNVQLTFEGQETTAFRFRLDEKGEFIPDSMNRIPKNLRAGAKS
jgi:hypothetical protein